LAAVRGSPPGSSDELGWAGCGPGGPTWPLGRWVRWPATPTGTGAGSSGTPASSVPVPGAAGRGLRPRVFLAHRPLPQLQVQDLVMGRRPIVGIAYIQTGKAFLLQAIFTPGQILCAGRFRLALWRKSGPRIVLPAHRMYCPVDIWPRSTTRGFCGDLRGAP
jgi:hypothetical protein